MIEQQPGEQEQQQPDATWEGERDLRALQERFGEPQPRLPQQGQPALEIEGVPEYVPPPPDKTRRGRKDGRNDG